MGRVRLPGPLDLDAREMCLINEPSPPPSPTRVAIPGPSGANDVANMDAVDRFARVLWYTAPLLPGDMQEEFLGLISPVNLLIMAGALALWAASHYFGVGFVIDGLMLVGGFVALGYQVWGAAKEFAQAIKTTARAHSDFELHLAAEHLAKFIAVVGVAVFTALVMKGVGKKLSPVTKSARGALAAAGARATRGLTAKHFDVFRQVAVDAKRIIGVRFTNPKSTPWIEKGYPGKPIEIKIKTSKVTGIVTALDAGEVATAKSKGYFVVGEDGVARNGTGAEMKLDRAEWPVEKGQVIHPTQQKPLVGDYDLAGVIDPNAKGRNLVLAASDGEVLNDWSNPETRRIAGELNSKMDQPRVMHGAHDGRFDVPTDAVFFMPDGTVLEFDTAEKVAEFYRSIGRQTITGSYR